MWWLLLFLSVPVGALAILWLVGERGHLVLPSTRAAAFCEMEAVTLLADERRGMPLDVRHIGLAAVAV
jgi:hypothetical protein